MDDIKSILIGDGVPPRFNESDMRELRRRADDAKKKHLFFDLVMGIMPYDLKAYNFALAYKKIEIPWEIMSKKQREFLLTIKDSLEKK